MELRGKRLQLALAITGAIAWILQGYDQALMNGLLTLPSFVATFPAIDTTTPELKARNSTLEGTAVALYEVGAAIGALVCFVIGNRFGRKKTAMGACIAVLVGVVLQATSFQLAQLIIARIVTGLGVGSITATLPTWVGESAEAHNRGWLIMLEGSGAIFGVMFVGWLELGFYFVPHNTYQEVSWRFPIAFQALFPILALCAMPFLVESPRWLLAKDRIVEGRAALARFEDGAEESAVVNARVDIVLNSLCADGEGHSSDPFAKTPNRHINRTLLAIGVNILAQMAGVNVITFYSNTIFETYLGYSSILSRIITSCLQTWQFLAATSAVLLIDRFGRRRLLLVAATLMIVANAGLAGLQSHAAESSTIAGCSLIFYLLALGVYPIGLFLVPFMYASEIAPLRIRSQVTAMSTCSNWLFNFLIAEITPVAFDSISWKYYLVYVCTNCLGVTVFYPFCPETKGRTLEDIDALFLGSKNALQPVKRAKLMRPGVAEDLDMRQKADVQAEKLEDVD